MHGFNEELGGHRSREGKVNVLCMALSMRE